MSGIFDLHAHPSFKPFNNKDNDGSFPNPDMWQKRKLTDEEKVWLFEVFNTGSVYESQINLDAAIEGNMRCISLALYPLERGFVKRGSRQDNKGPFGNNFLNLDKLISFITGFDVSRINELQSFARSYFAQLEEEYSYLRKYQSIHSFSEHGYEYQLVNSFDEIQAALNHPTKKIFPMILSIEGAHAFASDVRKKGRVVNMVKEEKKKKSKYFNDFQEQLLDNILKVKTEWKNPPLFVTFSHHFYNHLAGHAKTFDFPVSALGWLLHQKGRVDGTKYFNLGITDFGKQALDLLLMRYQKDGKQYRSILIDVKHMSAQARIDYYELLQTKYIDQHIPIICSHSGVNGRKSILKAYSNPPKKKDRKKSTFNVGKINLFDDEISRIIDSDGLIGIMIDERRILGKRLPQDAATTDMSTYKKWKKQDSQKAKKVCISLIFNQLFHIVEVYGRDIAWTHVCLGSDYEGLINPVDLYTTAGDLKNMETDFVEHWEECLQSADFNNPQIKRYKEYVFDKTPAHYIRKFLWGNAMDFLQKYFNDDYLLNGNPQTIIA